MQRARGNPSPSEGELDLLTEKEIAERKAFARRGDEIYEAHIRQTVEDVKYLNKKYERPSFGKKSVYETVGLLSHCCDETDNTLWALSQLTHVLQIAEGMEKDGVTDPVLWQGAFLHDLGKILLLYQEAPENVVCINFPIGDFPPDCGLDNVIFQWNHDEFIYMRMRDHVSPEVAWLIRYHSIRVDPSLPFMDDKDKEYLNKYLLPFRKYDFGSKSAYHQPRKNLAAYRDFLETTFPKAIEF